MQGLRTDAGASSTWAKEGSIRSTTCGSATRTQGIARLAGLYYLVKPLMPRSVRSRCAAGYAAPPRPAGVPALADRGRARPRTRRSRSGARIAAAGADSVPFVNFWPDGHRFALRAHPRRRGAAGRREHRAASARSSVRTALSRPGTSSPRATRSRTGSSRSIRADGCEIGLHGIKHDRKLLRDRARLRGATLPKIHRYLAEWQAVGWRSPATHRNADWMPRARRASTTALSRTPTRSSRRRAAAARSSRSSSTRWSSCRSRSSRTTRCSRSCSAGDRAVDREERLDHREPRAREPRRPPGLPDRAGPARPLRPVPRLADEQEGGWHALPARSRAGGRTGREWKPTASR